MSLDFLRVCVSNCNRILCILFIYVDFFGATNGLNAEVRTWLISAVPWAVTHESLFVADPPLVPTGLPF